jgi:imidazole glycerol phosphate synthase glutamine amidotransferase subunit
VSNVVGILDYGVGNIHSIAAALKTCEMDFEIISKKQKFEKFSSIILPGVGAYPIAMEQVLKLNFDIEIANFLKSGKNLLGICLGMQLLTKKGYENDETCGLGFIDAEVVSLKSLGTVVKNKTIPNMGWRKIEICGNSRLYKNLTSKDIISYFAHSYAIEYNKEIDKSVTSTYDFYGSKIISSFENENIFGTQFHPEKSGEIGLKIIQNFLNAK